MKKIFLIFLLLSIALLSVAQTYKGTVYDTEGKPLPFANVELYSLPDSTFVEGTTTNDSGEFILEAEKVKDGYLLISFLGYKSATVPAKEDVGTIILKENEQKLDEVVIKSRRPILVQKAGKMVVGIQGSSLSNAGNLIDVLKRVPELQLKDNKITIFGKNNEVQSSAEYVNLQSGRIKSIEIDRNPSAKYNASDNTIVSINTKELPKDRINLQLYNNSYFAKKYSNVCGVRFNSKQNKTETSINYSYNFSNNKNYEDVREINTQPSYILEKKNHSVKLPERKIHNLFASIIQEIGDKHTLGAQFSYVNKKIEKDINTQQQISKKNISTIQRQLQNTSNYDDVLATYNINYQLDLDGVTTFKVLADYTHSTENDKQQILEKNITENSLEQSSLKTNTKYDVYSAKTDFESLIRKKIPYQLGIKLSQVENEGSTLLTDLSEQKERYTSSNKTTDCIGAAYVLVKPKFGAWNFETGLRYEYIDRDIVAKGTDIFNSSYGKWFPSLKIYREFNPKLKFSLSYTKKISRPSFSELNNNKNYIDSLAYSMGNPNLKATINHNIAMNFGISKRLFIGVEYQYNKHDRIISAISDANNPDIIAYTNINVDKSQYLIATIDYRQSYKFWQGVLSIGIEKPFMEIPYLDKIKKIRKISYYFHINNDFKVSEKVTLFSNFHYNSPSEDLISYRNKSYNLSAGINTSFFKKKLKLSLYLNDILNTSETTWKDQYGNVASYIEEDRDNTFLRVSLKYNINNYKGGISKKTAGSEEINRM